MNSETQIEQTKTDKQRGWHIDSEIVRQTKRQAVGETVRYGT